MASAALQRVREALERTVGTVTVQAEGKLAARCPAHADAKPSLSVWTRDGRTRVKCHAGCHHRAVLAALGLSQDDLRDEPQHVTATYRYTDEQGNLLYERLRYGPRKDFKLRRPDGEGAWIWDLKGVTPVLYRLPEVLQAIRDGRTIYITEGEKDADALVKSGEVATTAGGATSWRRGMRQTLKQATVVVVADKDEPGRKAADKIAKDLLNVAADVTVVEAAGDETVKDAFDHLAAGLSVADFMPVGGPASETEFTDAHLVDRVAREVLRERYVWSRGMGWFQWDGKRWLSVANEAARERIRKWVLHNLEIEKKAAVAALADNDQVGYRAHENVAKLWLRACSRHRLEAIAVLARGRVEHDDALFDSQPDLLNVGNGVVDLRTGELRPHNPNLWFTKLTKVDYVPAAMHRDWQQALKALPPEVADWMQVRIGQAATGHVPDDDIIAICQGSGKNGKSTVFTGVQRALGEFHTMVSDRALMANPNAHPTELMDLRGARFALIEETPEERRLDMARVKKITGAVQLTARRIAKDPVTFDLTHSLFVTSNYRPTVEQTDHGTWRRLALVRFPYTFTGQDEDPTLRARLKQDKAVHQAVLAWIVEGARRWYKRGHMPNPPEQVVIDTDEWRKASDLIMRFWDERLVADPDSHVSTVELRRKFNLWLMDTGQKEWSDRTFRERFASHEVTERHHVVRGRAPKRVGEARPHVWFGVRFAQTSDQQGPAGPGQSEGSIRGTNGLKPSGSAGPAGPGLGPDSEEDWLAEADAEYQEYLRTRPPR